MTPRHAQEVSRFVCWFHSEGSYLRSLSAEIAADRIAAELERVDERLGIEIGEDDDRQPRELIFTAYSDTSLFGVVYDLVAKLGDTEGWHIVPLKPPRGFDFQLDLGSIVIDASILKFSRLDHPEGGLALIASKRSIRTISALPDGGEELGWLIVETGIGEELAASITHIEFSPPRGTETPIQKLPETIEGRE